MAESTVTGRDLALLRRERELRQGDVARAWPCSREYVGQLEAACRPSPAAVTRYLAALQRAEAAA